MLSSIALDVCKLCSNLPLTLLSLLIPYHCALSFIFFELQFGYTILGGSFDSFQ